MPNLSAAIHSGDEAPSPGGGRFLVRTRQNVSLGPLHMTIRSNEKPFTELHYFPEGMRLPQDAPTQYTVNCCNLNVDGPWPLQKIRNAQDKTYRAGRFSGGYYLTDHFGPPAYLITEGTQLWIFAPRFEPILWPFVVKLLLTTYSIDRQMLHLKAAAVSMATTATLLVGRGGTGKTVLLTRLCQEGGAQFLSNTHVLVQDEAVMPIPSAMRVRNDRLFAPLIAARGLPRAIKTDEFLADPFADLGWKIGTTAPLRNICLLDYRGRDRQVIREMDRNILFDYMETFSLALNIYGLREDVLDYLGGDVTQFSAEWSQMKTRLRALVDRCRCFYIRCDATDSDNLRTIRRLLDES
jgi:hypothetical protein